MSPSWFEAYDQLGALVVVYDADARIVHWNRACSELSGYDFEEVRGTTPWETLLAPQDAEQTRRGLLELPGRFPQQLSSTWLTKRGDRRRIRWSHTVSNDRGQRRVIATGVDVTATTREREDAPGRLESLIEQAPDGIFVADLEGRYTEVNRAGCEMLGYTREEILGKTILDVIPPDDVERLWEVRQQLLQTGGTHVAEWMLRRKDGSALPVEISARILPDGRWQGFVRDVSRRKDLEDERRKSQELLESILMISLDAIISIDEKQRIVMYNEGARQIFGWTREEVLGKPIDILLPQRFRQIHRRHIEVFASDPSKVRRMGERGQGILGLRKSGEEFAAEASISKVEVGETRLFTVTLRDVSEQRRTDEQLRLSEARFRVSLRDSPAVIFNQDRDLRYTWIHNPHLSLPVEQVLGRTDEELLPAEDARRLMRIKRRVLEAGVGTREIIRATLDGEPRFYDLTVEPLRDETGRIAGITCAAWDVTAGKRTEDELRFMSEVGAVLMGATLDYEETLSTMARLAVRHLADVAIVDIVEDGEVYRLRVAHADSVPAAVAESIERFELDRRRPHLMAGVLEQRRPVLLDELTPEYLESVAQNAEHLRTLQNFVGGSFIAVPLLARGNLLGALALISCRPDRRYGDRHLALAEEMANLAALGVDNARLHASLQRAIRVRDEVVGMVAHDLRTPLQRMLLATQLLQDEAEAADRRDTRPVQIIARAVEQMNRLLQDMLDVAQAEAKSLTLQPERIGARAVAQMAADAHREAAAAARVALHCEIEPGVGDVLADHQRLLQVFDNLVGNAIKFTPRGGSIGVGASRQDEHFVEFWVEDTGPGIPAANIPHVFDRFWRGRPDRHGAGLGLPIAKGIVEAHGGRIWVDPERDLGTRFCFTLPAAPASQPVARASEESDERDDHQRLSAEH